MPHSLHFLQEHCQAGSEKMLARGYRWFSNTFIPTLKKTSEVSSDTFLVAEAWLLVGEVYELLHAPLQALTCYQIGLHFNPEESDLYRWKALVEEQLGNYVAALSSIEKAVQYTNEAEDLMIDRQRIQDCLVYDKTPEFEEGDLVWECNEQLTNDEFEAVLQITNPAQTSNIERLKCAYRAYGALQETAKGEALWQRILRLDSHATLSEIDLFYWS